jgi:hypothetical protein
MSDDQHPHVEPDDTEPEMIEADNSDDEAPPVNDTEARYGADESPA